MLSLVLVIKEQAASGLESNLRHYKFKKDIKNLSVQRGLWSPVNSCCHNFFSIHTFVVQCIISHIFLFFMFLVVLVFLVCHFNIHVFMLFYFASPIILVYVGEAILNIVLLLLLLLLCAQARLCIYFSKSGRGFGRFGEITPFVGFAPQTTLGGK